MYYHIEKQRMSVCNGKNTNQRQEECPVARALEAIGDKWSLMIIRDAFDNVRRFSEFQKSLGLAKNILSARLRTLVELGILRMQPASDGSAYKEYVLTDNGMSIFPVIVSLRQWGEQYLFESGETHSILLDVFSRLPLEKLEVRTTDGQILVPENCYRKRVIKI